MLEYNESSSVIKNDREVLKFVIIFFTVVTYFAYSILNSTIFNLIWQLSNIEKIKFVNNLQEFKLYIKDIIKNRKIKSFEIIVNENYFDSMRFYKAFNEYWKV